MLITLNEIKAHLRLDQNNTIEDDLIKTYVNASVLWCESFLNKKIIASGNAAPNKGEIVLNEAIKNAVYIMTADLYENRQTVDALKNTTAERLLQFYRGFK